MKTEERIGEYPVEIWWERGLPSVRAVKDRKAGWQRCKELLVDIESVGGIIRPKLRILRRNCPNLIKQLSDTMASPKDRDEIDNGTKNDHAIDSFRYCAMWRVNPVKCPEVHKGTEFTGRDGRPLWMDQNKKQDYI